MTFALEEARTSLKEKNFGFGAVIVKNGNVIAKAHDTEMTAKDPTAHAEMNAIRLAASKLGINLHGCLLVSTHEPCPMCATAIVWSGINQVAYGYSIKDAIAQGRKRIDLPCREIFDRAGFKVTVHEGILKVECSILYNDRVRKHIKQLRSSDRKRLRELGEGLTQKRLEWFAKHYNRPKIGTGDILEMGYDMFLRNLGIMAEEAPIVEKSDDRIVIHSKNFCTTLEACKILGLDTRVVCKEFNEDSMDKLLKQLSPRLKFIRNYDKLRPYSECCEEMIILVQR